MKKLNSFHLAIPVNNLDVCKDFYENILECKPGRNSDSWADYNFFGHQLVVHLDKNISKKTFNAVDGKKIPIPHFGLVLDWIQWESLKQKLQKSNMEFIVDPYIRFKGQIGEQATMFFLDPSGNALEFKAFKNMDQLFAH